MGLYALPLHPTPCHQKSPSRLSTSYLLTIYGQYQAASILSRVGVFQPWHIRLGDAIDGSDVKTDEGDMVDNSDDFEDEDDINAVIEMNPNNEKRFIFAFNFS